MTVLDPVDISDLAGTGDPLTHVSCFVCFPNPSPGDRAICGSVLKIGMTGGTAASAECVVCQALRPRKPCGHGWQ